MEDESDIKKMMNVLNKNKQENLEDFQYEEFINCDDSDAEEVDDPEETNEEEDFTFLDNTLSMEITNLYKYDPISSLRSEEILVIDSCGDPILKKILLLNRNKNMQLIQLYKKIKDLLIECKQNIIEKNEIVKEYIKIQKKHYISTGSWKLGAPYFKTDKLYCCPLNDDAKRKRANRELTIYEMFPLSKWTNFECQRLVGAVKVNYNMNQQNEIKKRIKAICLESESSEEDNNEILKELHGRLKELQENENSEVPSLVCDDNIDWERVAEVFIKDKHTAFECRSFWRMFLHPAINKTSWRADENKKLKEIAKRYNYQNWDEIAKELGTNRSSLTACINYYSCLHITYKKGEFTIAEDRKLLDLINRYKMGSYIPWVKIVRHFKNRNRAQLHHRYTYCLSQSDKKKGKWTQAEDIVLMICVDKFGQVFKKCSQYLPHRSITQCKSRYSSNLKNCLKKGTWTVEDDRAIVDLVASSENRSWTSLVQKLSRCRGQIRQRYQVIQEFLRANPDKTVEDVPKRKHGWKNDIEEETFSFMRKVADHYKNLPCIPTVEKIQEQLDSNVFNQSSSTIQPKIEKLSEEEKHSTELEKNVDDMLTDFFFDSYECDIVNQLPPKDIREATNIIYSLLNLLQVDLEIPLNLDSFKLDAIDRLILEEIAMRPKPNIAESYGARANCINKLLPVDINNTFGLRTLLNTYLNTKSTDLGILGNIEIPRASASIISFHILKQLSMLPATLRSVITEDRLLFFKRFLSLFKWPALLTLEGPSAELLSSTDFTGLNIRPPAAKTYGRKKKAAEKVDGAPDNKKPKVAEAGTSTLIKLTPVTDNSVIENLMKDRNKKLFYLSKVKCGNKLKTISREIKLLPSNHKLDSNPIIPSKSVVNNITASCSYDKESETCSVDSQDQSMKYNNSVRNSRSVSQPDDAGDLSKLESFLKRQQEDDDSENDQEWPIDQCTKDKQKFTSLMGDGDDIFTEMDVEEACPCDSPEYWEILKSHFEEQTILLKDKEQELRNKIAQVEALITSHSSSLCSCEVENEIPRVFPRNSESPMRDSPTKFSPKGSSGFFQKVMENAKSILTMKCSAIHPSNTSEIPTRDSSCSCDTEARQYTSSSSKGVAFESLPECSLCDDDDTVTKNDTTADSYSQEVNNSFSCNGSCNFRSDTSTYAKYDTTISTGECSQCTSHSLSKTPCSLSTGHTTGVVSCGCPSGKLPEYPDTVTQNRSTIMSKMAIAKFDSCWNNPFKRETNDEKLDASAMASYKTPKKPCDTSIYAFTGGTKCGTRNTTPKHVSSRGISPCFRNDILKKDASCKICPSTRDTTTSRGSSRRTSPERNTAACCVCLDTKKSSPAMEDFPKCLNEIDTNTDTPCTVDTCTSLIRQKQNATCCNIEPFLKPASSLSRRSEVLRKKNPCRSSTCRLRSISKSFTAPNITSNQRTGKRKNCTIQTCPSKKIRSRSNIRDVNNQCAFIGSPILNPSNFKGIGDTKNIVSDCSCSTTYNENSPNLEGRGYKDKMKELFGRDKFDNVLRNVENCANQPICCCVNAQKGDSKSDEIRRITEELKLENQILKGEVLEMKYELKHCIENIEGPIKQKLKTERSRCEYLQRELDQASQNMLGNQDTYQRETNSLKLQLCLACSNMTELNDLNKRLKEEMKSLDSMCAKLEEDLLKQKLNEADTIRRLTKRTNVGAPDFQCTGRKFSCDSNLNVIARKLSKTLKESAPCEECSKHPELTGAANMIKNLTDMVEKRKALGFLERKIESKKDCSCQSRQTEEDSCQCNDFRDIGAGESKGKNDPAKMTKTLFSVSPTFVKENESSNFNIKGPIVAAEAQISESRYYSAHGEPCFQDTCEDPDSCMRSNNLPKKWKVSETHTRNMEKQQQMPERVTRESEPCPAPREDINIAPSLSIGKPCQTVKIEMKNQVQSSGKEDVNEQIPTVTTTGSSTDKDQCDPIPKAEVCEDIAPSEDIGEPCPESTSVEEKVDRVVDVPKKTSREVCGDVKPCEPCVLVGKTCQTKFDLVEDIVETIRRASISSAKEAVKHITDALLSSVPPKSKRESDISEDVPTTITATPEVKVDTLEQEQVEQEITTQKYSDHAVKMITEALEEDSQNQKLEEILQLKPVTADQSAVQEKIVIKESAHRTEESVAKENDTNLSDSAEKKQIIEEVIDEVMDTALKQKEQKMDEIVDSKSSNINEQKQEVGESIDKFIDLKSSRETIERIIDIESPHIKEQKQEITRIDKVVDRETKADIQEKEQNIEDIIDRSVDIKSPNVKQDHKKEDIIDEIVQSKSADQPKTIVQEKDISKKLADSENLEEYQKKAPNITDVSKTPVIAKQQLPKGKLNVDAHAPGELISEEIQGEFPFEVDTTVAALNEPPPGLLITTTITKSGNLEVITEGPNGVIETTLNYTEDGVIEVITQITEVVDEDTSPTKTDLITAAITEALKERDSEHQRTDYVVPHKKVELDESNSSDDAPNERYLKDASERKTLPGKSSKIEGSSSKPMDTHTSSMLTQFSHSSSDRKSITEQESQDFSGRKTKTDETVSQSVYNEMISIKPSDGEFPRIPTDYRENMFKTKPTEGTESSLVTPVSISGNNVTGITTENITHDSNTTPEDITTSRTVSPGQEVTGYTTTSENVSGSETAGAPTDQSNQEVSEPIDDYLTDQNAMGVTMQEEISRGITVQKDTALMDRNVAAIVDQHVDVVVKPMQEMRIQQIREQDDHGYSTTPEDTSSRSEKTSDSTKQVDNSLTDRNAIGLTMEEQLNQGIMVQNDDALMVRSPDGLVGENVALVKPMQEIRTQQIKEQDDDRINPNDAVGTPLQEQQATEYPSTPGGLSGIGKVDTSTDQNALVRANYAVGTPLQEQQATEYPSTPGELSGIGEVDTSTDQNALVGATVQEKESRAVTGQVDDALTDRKAIIEKPMKEVTGATRVPQTLEDISETSELIEGKQELQTEELVDTSGSEVDPSKPVGITKSFKSGIVPGKVTHGSEETYEADTSSVQPEQGFASAEGAIPKEGAVTAKETRGRSPQEGQVEVSEARTEGAIESIDLSANEDSISKSAQKALPRQNKHDCACQSFPPPTEQSCQCCECKDIAVSTSQDTETITEENMAIDKLSVNEATETKTESNYATAVSNDTGTTKAEAISLDAEKTQGTADEISNIHERSETDREVVADSYIKRTMTPVASKLVSQRKSPTSKAEDVSGHVTKEIVDVDHGEDKFPPSSDFDKKQESSEKYKTTSKKSSEVPDSVSKLSDSVTPVVNSSDTTRPRKKRSSKLENVKCDCVGICQCVVCSPEIISKRIEMTGNPDPPIGESDQLCCCTIQPSQSHPQMTCQVNQVAMQSQHFPNCVCSSCKLESCKSGSPKFKTEAFLRSTNLDVTQGAIPKTKKRTCLDDIFNPPCQIPADCWKSLKKSTHSHPADCECIDCLCLPKIQKIAQMREFPIVKDEKQIYQVTTMKCSCINAINAKKYVAERSRIPISTNSTPVGPPKIKPLSLPDCICDDCDCCPGECNIKKGDKNNLKSEEQSRREAGRENEGQKIVLTPSQLAKMCDCELCQCEICFDKPAGQDSGGSEERNEPLVTKQSQMSKGKTVHSEMCECSECQCKVCFIKSEERAKENAPLDTKQSQMDKAKEQNKKNCCCKEECTCELCPVDALRAKVSTVAPANLLDTSKISKVESVAPSAISHGDECDCEECTCPNAAALRTTPEIGKKTSEFPTSTSTAQTARTAPEISKKTSELPTSTSSAEPSKTAPEINKKTSEFPTSTSSAEPKVSSLSHPEDCDCQVCTCPMSKNKEVTKNAGDSLPHPDDCDCKECVSCPLSPGKAATTSAKLSQTASTNAKETRERGDQSQKPPTEDKPIMGCDCISCDCDPCADPNKTKPQKPIVTKIMPCDCTDCKCNPCADPTKQKPPSSKQVDLEKGDAKTMDDLPKCTCVVCKCPGKDEATAISKDSHPDDCDCADCLCAEEIMHTASEFSHKSKSDHPEECDCDECKCPGAEKSASGAQVRPTSDEIRDHSSQCICDVCKCPGAEKVTSGAQVRPTSDEIRDHSSQCICDVCKCPGAEKVTSGAQVRPIGQEMGDHLKGCICDVCKCPGAEKGTSVAQIRLTGDKTRDHPEECICDICKCPDEKVEARPAFMRDKAIHTPGCTCDECFCSEETLQDIGCSCAVCTCTDCYHKNKREMDTLGCKCGDCVCEDCSKMDKTEVKSTPPKEVRTVLNKCACGECVCVDCFHKIDKAEIKECKCGVCKCQDCLFGVVTQAESRKQDASVPAVTSRSCHCLDCECDVCSNQDRKKKVVKPAETTKVIGTPEPIKTATHPDGCTCLTCLCIECFAKLKQGEAGDCTTKTTESTARPIAASSARNPNCKCVECVCEDCCAQDAKYVFESATQICHCNDCKCDDCFVKRSQVASKQAASEQAASEQAASEQAAPKPQADSTRAKTTCKCTECKVDCLREGPFGLTCHCPGCECDECIKTGGKASKKLTTSVFDPPMFEVPIRKPCDCNTCSCVICEQKKQQAGAVAGNIASGFAGGPPSGKNLVATSEPPPFEVPIRLPCSCTPCTCTFCNKEAVHIPPSSIFNVSTSSSARPTNVVGTTPPATLEAPPFNTPNRLPCNCGTCTCTYCNKDGGQLSSPTGVGVPSIFNVGTSSARPANVFGTTPPATLEAPPLPKDGGQLSSPTGVGVQKSFVVTDTKSAAIGILCDCPPCSCFEGDKIGNQPMDGNVPQQSVPLISLTKSEPMPDRPSSAPVGVRQQTPIHCDCPTCTCPETSVNFYAGKMESIPNQPVAEDVSRVTGPPDPISGKPSGEPSSMISKPSTRISEKQSEKVISIHQSKSLEPCQCAECRCQNEALNYYSGKFSNAQYVSGVASTVISGKQSRISGKPSGESGKSSKNKEDHPAKCDCTVCTECVECPDPSIPRKGTDRNEPTRVVQDEMPERDVHSENCNCPKCCKCPSKVGGLDLSNMDSDTLRKEIQVNTKESCECREQITEIKKALNKIKCACTEAEMKAVKNKPLVKQASAFGQTMSGLKLALNNLQEKCKAKDRMIDAMTGELKMRTSCNTFEKVLNTKISEAPDYDRAEDVKSFENPTNMLYPVEEEKGFGEKWSKAMANEKSHKSRKKSSRTCGCEKSNKDKVNLTGFEVVDIRRITQDSIIIKWKPPKSSSVTGYDIFINGVNKSKVMSGGRTSAMIHSLDLSATIQVTIYAVMKCGRCEPPAIAIYEIRS